MFYRTVGSDDYFYYPYETAREHKRTVVNTIARRIRDKPECVEAARIYGGMIDRHFLGDDPTYFLADVIVRSWAQTSNKGAKATLIQECAREEFGLPDVNAPARGDIEQLFWNTVHANGYPESSEQMWVDMMPGVKTMLREIYNATQEHLADIPDNMPLFRGIGVLNPNPGAPNPVTWMLRNMVGGGRGDAAVDLGQGAKARGIGSSHAIATRPLLNPLSSFSTNYNVAANFATSSWIEKVAESGRNTYDNASLLPYIGAPILIVSLVKKKDILSTPYTGIGCGNESEAVVLGRNSSALAIVINEHELIAGDITRVVHNAQVVDVP